MTKRMFIHLLALSTALLMSTALYAEDSDTQAYAIMQACLATAIDVPDAGTYEQYCIDQYLANSAAVNNG